MAHDGHLRRSLPDASALQQRRKQSRSIRQLHPRIAQERRRKEMDLRRPLERSETRTTLEYGSVDAPRLVGRFLFAARRLAIPLQGAFSTHGSYHSFVRTVSYFPLVLRTVRMDTGSLRPQIHLHSADTPSSPRPYLPVPLFWIDPINVWPPFRRSSRHAPPTWRGGVSRLFGADLIPHGGEPNPRGSLILCA